METTQLGKKLGQQSNQKINGYVSEFGCIDTRTPKSVYLNLSGWVMPVTGDLTENMKLFEAKLRYWVDNGLEQLFKNKLNPRMPIIRIINHADSLISSNAIRVNSTYTFFDIEIVLYFVDNVSVRDEKTKENFLLLLYSLVEFLAENREFSFQPTKK